MLIIKQFIYAFFSIIGFAVLFNIPRNCIIKSGIVGSLGWLVDLQITNITASPVAGAFWGAVTVGIVGEAFARIFKKPVTIFIVPGIVPLVPGSGMYYTMLAITEKRFIDAANVGSETTFIAASIASGIIIASSLSRIYRRRKKAI